jgi:hypothetical protein
VSRRRAVIVGLLAIATMLLHALLVRIMAHGHIAHVLLGSGNQTPPIGAALLAIALVVGRFAAVVVGPGVLLASLTSIVAHALVGPKGARYRDEGGGGEGTGTKSGTGIHSDDEGSGAGSTGTGLNIEGRAT